MEVTKNILGLVKYFSATCLLSMAFHGSSPWAAEQKITIAAEGNTYEDFGSEAAATVKTVLEAMNYEVDIVELPWARALNMTKDGAFAGLVSVYFSEERSQYLAYTDPVSMTEVLFYGLRSKPVPYTGSLTELAQLRIAVVRNYTYGDEFDRAKGFYKVASLNPETSIRMLLGDRVDLIVGSRRVIDFLLARHFPQQQHLVEALPTPLTTKPVYMTFSRKYPQYADLVSYFNAELAKLKRIAQVTEPQ